MSRKKKVIAIVAILLTIFMSFIGGQTYAKYATEIRARGTAQVATWSFKVNDEIGDIAESIDLASTVNDQTLANNKIAPGTQGSFVIKIDGTDSEVGIKYELSTKTQVDKPTNLKFKYNGTTYDTIGALLADAGGYINANDTDKVRNIQIDWEWPYETGETAAEKYSGDLSDTDNGRSNTNFKFDICVKGTQVMPNA